MREEVLVFIPIGFFVMVGFIVWAGVQSRNRRAQMQAEVQTKLIEKFGTASEFVQFLQSPAGRQFLAGSPQAAARYKVFGGVRAGIMLSFLGVGFLFLAIFTERDFIIPGFILLFLGIGFFLSSAVAMRLTKKLETPDLTQQQL
jgi:hypothetical protein